MSLPVQIAQENGGNLEVIWDFGLVPLNGDKTFKAKVNFNRDQKGTTTPEDSTTLDVGNGDSSGGGGPDNGLLPDGSDPGSHSSGDGAKSGKSSDGASGIKVLPKTGGVDLTTLGMGILLIAGGLLIRKIYE